MKKILKLSEAMWKGVRTGSMNGLKFPSCLSIERWISHDPHVQWERGAFVRAFERWREEERLNEPSLMFTSWHYSYIIQRQYTTDFNLRPRVHSHTYMLSSACQYSTSLFIVLKSRYLISTMYNFDSVITIFYNVVQICPVIKVWLKFKIWRI